MDLNEEAIQICQLSLWIKTAARGKQLTSLDHATRAIEPARALAAEALSLERSFSDLVNQAYVLTEPGQAGEPCSGRSAPRRVIPRNSVARSAALL
jgi:hypothetical protein